MNAKKNLNQKRGVFFSFFIIIFLAGGSALFAENWKLELFNKATKGYAPQWAKEQIEEDLAPFMSGISKQQLDNTMASSAANQALLVRYTISNGKISVRPAPALPPEWIGFFEGRLKNLTHSLDQLNQCVNLPNVDFIVSLYDDCTTFRKEEFQAPVFSFAKDKMQDSRIILMPDFESLEDHTYLFQEIRGGVLEYPWQMKTSKAFWRGTTTGVIKKINGTFDTRYTYLNYLEFPRVKLTQLSLAFPDLIDAKFNSLCQGAEQLVLQFNSFLGNFTPIREHLKYKYQILIDGNSCAYTRAYWELFSETVMFKQTSDNVQWYYRALQPYVHYIPINNDVSDLLEKIKWAQMHDETAFKIAQNAKTFAEGNLQTSDVYLYFYLILQAYAKLLKE
ncbi:MAG: glycosyl transferase family 90 [Anaerolineae bacterium]